MPGNIQFSVVVPAHNRAPLIHHTLDAILAQSHPPAEILVVDDGSTDATAEIVARYSPRIRLIRTVNGGAPGARDIGVRDSSADWLAFCDSDDLWRPDHLARLATVFATTDVPFAFTNFVHIFGQRWDGQTKFDMDSSGFWRRPGRPSGDAVVIADDPLLPRILAYQPIFQSCIAMSRDFYRRIGGYNSAFGRVGSEDLEFTLRCARLAPTGIVLEPTVGIRKHPGNNSGNLTKQLCGEIDILRYAQTNHDLPPDWIELIAPEITKRSLQAIDAAFATGRLDVVRRLAPTVRPMASSGKLRTKLAISALPDFLATPLCNLLTGAQRAKHHGRQDGDSPE